MAGERLKLIQSSELLEDLGIQLQGRRRTVTTGTTAGALFSPLQMGRRIGAEEEFRIAADRHLLQRLLMATALEHRQTVVVGADAAHQQVVAVHQQMLGGDGRRHPLRGRQHKLDRLRRGDVLHHHLQMREATNHGDQMAFDEDSLAIEDIDLFIGHLAVDQQRHLQLGQRLEHRLEPIQAGDRQIRVGGGAGRIELDRHHARRMGGPDHLGRGVVGQIEGHQGGEVAPRRTRRLDALPIGHRHLGIQHRRHQVGHDDGAGEGAGRGRHRLVEQGAIAQVQMPVIRRG